MKSSSMGTTTLSAFGLDSLASAFAWSCSVAYAFAMSLFKHQETCTTWCCQLFSKLLSSSSIQTQVVRSLGFNKKLWSWRLVLYVHLRLWFISLRVYGDFSPVPISCQVTCWKGIHTCINHTFPLVNVQRATYKWVVVGSREVAKSIQTFELEFAEDIVSLPIQLHKRKASA